MISLYPMQHGAEPLFGVVRYGVSMFKIQSSMFKIYRNLMMLMHPEFNAFEINFIFDTVKR